MWHVWLEVASLFGVLLFLPFAFSKLWTLATGMSHMLSGVSREETHSAMTMRSNGVLSRAGCLIQVAASVACLAVTVALAYGLGWSIVDCRLSLLCEDKYAMTLFDYNVASLYAEQVPEDPKVGFLSFTPYPPGSGPNAPAPS